jgi:uncharacterized repeat protein (TIGR01451 family)
MTLARRLVPWRTFIAVSAVISLVASGGIIGGSSRASAQGSTPAPAQAGEAGHYFPLTPFRILDTRTGQGTPTASPGPIGPGGTLNLQVTGVPGAVDGVPGASEVVPAGATAVVLNVTAVQPTTSGFLTVWPTGAPRPVASNINFVPNDVRPNLVQVALPAGGQVSIFNSFGNTQVVADVQGYFDAAPAGAPTQGLFNPITPHRILDTRDGTGVPPRPAAPLAGGSTLNLQVTGQGGVPPAGVEAVVLNLTATNVRCVFAGPICSFLTVWPTGQPQPVASNSNFGAGQTRANRVIVPVGAGGMVSIFNHFGNVDVVVDVDGWFTDATPGLTGSVYTPVTPVRILDTRPGTGNVGGSAAPFGPMETRSLRVTGTPTSAGPVPADATAAVANATVDNTTAPSFLTVWPSDEVRPTSSDLNWVTGEIAANLVETGLSSAASAGPPVAPAGSWNIFNWFGTTNVIADLNGYYTPSTTPVPPTASLSVHKEALESSFTGVGQAIGYTFTITNTGNLPLTDTTVSDTGLSGLTSASCPPAPLAPGESRTCVAIYRTTLADLNRGSVSDTATATGRAPDGTTVTQMSNTVIVPGPQHAPSLTISKSAFPRSFTRAGQVILYTFRVTNNGNVTLTNTNVTDSTGASVVCTPPATLPPRVSRFCAAFYRITPADVANGEVTDTATATGTAPGGTLVSQMSNSVTVNGPKPAPSLTVDKRATTTGFEAAGEPIDYVFTVRNNGNVPLTDVALTDSNLSAGTGGATVTCPAGALATLAVGASVDCTGTYTTTATDVTNGSVIDQATATGTAPGGEAAAVSGESNVVSVPGLEPEEPNPSISVQKSVTPSELNTTPIFGFPFPAATALNYTFRVTNNGNVPVTGIAVTDLGLNVGITARAFDLASLAAGGEINLDAITPSLTPVQLPVVCPTTTLVAGASEDCTATQMIPGPTFDTTLTPGVPSCGGPGTIFGICLNPLATATFAALDFGLATGASSGTTVSSLTFPPVLVAHPLIGDLLDNLPGLLPPGLIPGFPGP